MKKLSSRAVAAITNGVLALVLVVVGAFCFLPTVLPASGVDDLAIRKGNSADGVSLMFNVYWGTDTVYGILDVLDEYDAKATFFLGGCWADDNIDCVREIVARGQEIGSHGYFHREHDKLSYADNEEEIRTSVAYLSEITGVGVGLFAPPSGAYNADTLAAAEHLGLKTVLWSKDTVDWRDKDEELCFSRATEGIGGGALILMHPMEHTLAALPRILSHYREHGLRAISVGENLS